jgi:hypothetical protein
MKKFLGIDCQEVGFGDLELLIAEPIGPRILSLSYQNSGNIFAELPDTVLAHPTMGEYRFYGGHRLWVAPEEPAITYEPDNRAVGFEWAGNGVNVIGEIEPGSGLRKSIRIQTTNYLNVIQVDHLVRNEGSSSRKIAPWAITQLKLGGTAVLPAAGGGRTEPASAQPLVGSVAVYRFERKPPQGWKRARVYPHAAKKRRGFESGGEQPAAMDRLFYRPIPFC